MAAVLAAASYSRIGFSLCIAVWAYRVRVPGGSTFHLEPGTIVISVFPPLDSSVINTSDLYSVCQQSSSSLHNTPRDNR